MAGKIRRFKNDAFLVALGARLRKLRTSKGFSIDRMHLESEGLNRSTISRLERGMIDPQISTLKRYADTIEVEIWDLLKIK